MASRAELLRLEIAEAEAEERFLALKEGRPVCSECGRPVRVRDQSKKQKATNEAIAQAGAALRAARMRFRAARFGEPVDEAAVAQLEERASGQA